VSAVRPILWLAIVMSLAPVVLAQDFSAEFNPAQQTISSDQAAHYNMTLFHNYQGVEFFEVYSPEVLWDIRTKDPLNVQPSTPFTTTIMVQPLNINPGTYGVPVHVKRTGSTKVRKAILYMEVTGSPSALTYLPAVRGTAEIPAFVDPREDIVITVYLENQNRRNLSDLDVKVRSDVINQDYKAALGPLERKTFTFTARVDSTVAPQQDTLTVTIIATEKDKGFQFDLPPVDYAVRSHGQLVPSIEVVKSFLKTARMITITNNGNIVIQEPFSFPLPWYARLFTRASPKPARTEQGQLVWDIALNVGHTSELRVTTNYIPLAIAIVLAAIITVLYYVLRSPLVVKKSASVLSTREGGISELKVLLELKNRSGKPIRHTTIVDLVPRIAELLKDHEMGTIAPSKTVRHERKGTIVKYEVGDVMPYEERVISYKIKSTLSILGGVSLPVAVARFVTHNGRERNTQSNAPKVNFLG